MSNLDLTGSCLCGSVRYEISGKSMHFFHCHCQRCRKATGTGHASNIIMQPSTVKWTTGNQNLSFYKVPDAKRFATVFCKTCGSLMPRVAPDKSVAVIPAGTLDNDPGVTPEARIFQESKASWSCEGDAIAVHDTYPPSDR